MAKGTDRPFGPGDTSSPDVRRILREVARSRRALEELQMKLTLERDGPGPDDTPPVVEEPTRAEGYWPWLLIRSFPGDMGGGRPFDPDFATGLGGTVMWSPDVLITLKGPPDEPTVIGREDIPMLQARRATLLLFNHHYDIWVHVWNLGRSAAYGVRVRAFLDPADLFLGGRQVDLGDRLSDTSHRVIKVGTYEAGVAGVTDGMIVATAECLTDPASGDRGPGVDRHTAHHYAFVYPGT